MQEMIDRLYAKLERAQVDDLVEKLNRANTQRLPTMWEVAMLDAFARQASFVHERALPNGRKPDLGGLRWEDGELDIHIIGDITCVSDTGRHEENPIEWFRREVQQRADRAGLAGLCFQVAVHGEYLPAPKQRRRRNSIFAESDAKATLALGAKKDLVALLDSQFGEFLARVKAAQTESHEFPVVDEIRRFAIHYRPGSRSHGGGHLSYTVAASLRRNPLANALERKADQLKAAPGDAIRLLVVCDGGCALMRGSLRNSGHPSTYSAFEIAQEFLNRSKTIDMVLLIGVRDAPFALSGGEPRRIQAELVVALAADRSARVTDGRIHSVHRMLERVIASLPPVAFDPSNAARFCLKDGCGHDDVGAWQLTTQGQEMKVRVSARGLQRLLAGELTPQQFADRHQWDQPRKMGNPFRPAHGSGRVITDATLIRQEGEDDDVIELTMVEGDAGNGPFLKRVAGGNDGIGD